MDLPIHENIHTDSGAASTDMESLVDETFQEALRVCASSFPMHEIKNWMEGGASILDVQRAVNDAQIKYENKKRSKATKWLVRLSSRVAFYSSALDVLAQHHPEYLALAWGSIKFVVIGLMNQEDLVKELAKALCKIGDALPQAEILLILHPTAMMKELVVTLYMQIIKFARRAVKWYRESPVMHAMKAITHPYSLRFQDTVENIGETSRRIERLALNMSMAELRRTREELAEARREQGATHVVAVETRQKIEAYHNIQFAGLLDTNRRVCEIQFSQLMSFANATPFATPEVTRGYHTVRRNRNRKRGVGSSAVFQKSSQLQAWASQSASTELAICGGFNSRRVIRDFAADIIDLALAAQMPTIWALDIPSLEFRYSPEDVVRYLVSQILRTNHTLLNERAGALSAARYQSASSVEEWFALLGSVLEGLSQVYFILDIEVLQKAIGSTASWVLHFRQLFERLNARSLQTTVKVAFLSSRSMHRAEIDGIDQRKVLQLPNTRSSRVNKRSESRRHKNWTLPQV